VIAGPSGGAPAPPETARAAARPPRSAAGGVVTVAPEPYDAPDAVALEAELMADLDERYAADGAVDGDHPEVVALHRIRVEQVTRPHGVFVVARVDGVAAACGAVRRLIGGPPDVGEIKRMYTRPAARRRGLSRVVLDRLEAEAADLGYRRVQLETGLRQPEAITLYETAGYRRIPSFGQYEGDELSVCFAKDLVAEDVLAEDPGPA
jgi:GNAT superfamily N-acetyltransferase